MSTNAYSIQRLVFLNNRQKAAADFVSHCSPTDLGRQMALAHLRHLFGSAMVRLNGTTGAIVVEGLFVAMPVQRPDGKPEAISL